MEIRKIMPEEFDAATELLEIGRHNISELGIDQWQDGDPSAENIRQDIADGDLYGAFENNALIGMAYIGFGGDPAYEVINGAWLSNGKFAVVHRVAVNTSYRGCGVFAALINYAKLLCYSNGCKSLKIDTHRGNTRMRSALKKNGFTYCGVIHLVTGQERVAYEMLL